MQEDARFGLMSFCSIFSCCNKNVDYPKEGLNLGRRQVKKEKI